MGQFSWITSDTNRQILNNDQPHGPTPVYCLIPNAFGGGSLFEDNYEGYGVFGGRDAYALLAEWNLPESEIYDENGEKLPDDELRMKGIDLQFEHYEKINFPLKFVEHECSYNEVGESRDDPNQGWEYEWDEDEYY